MNPKRGIKNKAALARNIKLFMEKQIELNPINTDQKVNANFPFYKVNANYF